MQRLDSMLRWVGAVGITLAPLCLFVIPQLIYAESSDIAEEQFRQMAEGSVGGYEGLVIQICGGVFLMAAALGIGGLTIARRRGRTLGAIGLIIGMVGAVSLLLVLGFEAAVAVILISSTTDTDAAVAMAVELFSSPWYTVPLLVGLGGLFLTLLILALALWRSRVVPIIVPLLFPLTLLTNLVPLPAPASSWVPSVLFVLPCIWMSVQLIRGAPEDAESIDTPTAPTAAQRDVVDS